MIGVARARGPNGKVGAGGGTSTILSDVEYSMTTCLQTSIAVEDGCGSFRSVTIPVATHLEIVHCTCTPQFVADAVQALRRELRPMIESAIEEAVRRFVIGQFEDEEEDENLGG